MDKKFLNRIMNKPVEFTKLQNEPIERIVAEIAQKPLLEQLEHLKTILYRKGGDPGSAYQDAGLVAATKLVHALEKHPDIAPPARVAKTRANKPPHRAPS